MRLLPLVLVVACTDRGVLRDDPDPPRDDTVVDTDDSDVAETGESDLSEPLPWVEIGYVACSWSSPTGLRCWGGDAGDITNPSWLDQVPDVEDVRSMALDGLPMLLIERDGDLSAWPEREADLVAALPSSGLVDADVSGNARCVVARAGRVTCDENAPAPPEGLARARRVILRKELACAIGEDAGVTCWGPGSDASSLPDTAIDGDAGWDATCLVASDGDVGCAGTDNGIVSGVDDVPGGASRVALSEDAACAIVSGGHVSCWTGVGSLAKNLVDRQPDTGGWVDVAVAGDVACAVDGEGRVLCWGGDWGGVFETQPDAR